MRMSKAARHAKVHEEAMILFDEINTATFDQRVMSLNDRLFNDEAGQQWAGLVEDDDGRPRIEINKIAGSIARIEGDFRNNRPAASFQPSDGSPKDAFADYVAGLKRADDQDSSIKEVDANTFGDMVKGGYGAKRVRTVPADPTDPSNDQQRIVFETIVDPESSVFCDLNSKKQNKSDMEHCFVLHTISHRGFKKKYGEDPATWTDGVKAARQGWDWYTPDVVTVAEYFVVEDEDEVFYVFRDVMGDTFERPAEDFEHEDDEDPEAGEGPEALQKLLTLGNELVEEKTRKMRRVRKYTMTASSIIEEETITGPNIPVVVYYAERSYIANKERWRGHVRKAKDAQRVFNALVSWLFEASSLPPERTPIFAPQQIRGHEQSWTRFAEGEKVPFLVADALRDNDGNPASAPGPMGFMEPSPLPAALAANLQFIGVDLKELLGSQDQGDKMLSNISGKAVDMIQRHLDAATDIYLENYALGEQRLAEIWWGMAQEVYVEPDRKMKTIAADGKTRGSITLGEPGVTDDGRVMLDGLYDLKKGKFDVIVTVGPSTDTQKEAAAQGDTALLAVIPPDMTEARALLTWDIMKNATGPNSEDRREFATKKLLEMGVGKPTKEQAAKMAEEQTAKAGAPDPVANLQNAAAQKEAALAQKAAADTQLSLAKVKETEASTVKISAEAQKVHVDGAVSLHNASKPPEPKPTGAFPPRA